MEKYVITNMLGFDIVDEVIVKHCYKHDHILKELHRINRPYEH